MGLEPAISNFPMHLGFSEPVRARPVHEHGQCFTYDMLPIYSVIGSLSITNRTNLNKNN